MGDFCKDCNYKGICTAKQEHPNALGCCEFGLFDENYNLIEDTRNSV